MWNYQIFEDNQGHQSGRESNKIISTEGRN